MTVKCASSISTALNSGCGREDTVFTGNRIEYNQEHTEVTGITHTGGGVA